MNHEDLITAPAGVYTSGCDRLLHLLWEPQDSGGKVRR